MTYQEIPGIKSLAEEDRPREKLLSKGREVLTSAELIAILIGSGSRDDSAVSLASRILSSVNEDIHELAKLNIDDLVRFRGIGTAKALSIISAMELGRRRQYAQVIKKRKIKHASDVSALFHPLIADLPHEEFWILLLNRSNGIIKKDRISKGGVSGTVVDVKIIFKIAIQYLASSIILCHNHPSSNLKPSQADIALTQKINKAGELMEIALLDHIIVGETGFYSFADQGMI